MAITVVSDSDDVSRFSSSQAKLLRTFSCPRTDDAHAPQERGFERLLRESHTALRIPRIVGHPNDLADLKGVGRLQ